MSRALRLFDVAAPPAHRAASYQLAPPPSPLYPGPLGPHPTAFHASPSASALRRALPSFSEFTSRLRCDSRFYCELTCSHPRYGAAGTPGPTPFLSSSQRPLLRPHTPFPRPISESLALFAFGASPDRTAPPVAPQGRTDCDLGCLVWCCV